MNDIGKLQDRARAVAEAHDALRAEMEGLDRELRAVRERHEDRLKYLAHEYAACRDMLLDGVRSNPGLFERPRSRQVDTVKYGWRKQKGTIELPDRKDWLLDKMRSILDEDYLDKCVDMRPKFKVSEIAQLPGAVLKRLGVRIGEDRDAPFVIITESTVEADVAALIEQIEREEAA